MATFSVTPPSRFILVFALALLPQQQAISEEIVRVDMISDGVPASVDISLFEEINPLTSSNFLTYVDDGDFTKTFFHRNVSDFVLQTGGFTYDSTLNTGLFTYDSVNDIFTGGLRAVPTDSPVINEYRLSNTRGTIAMAKLGGDPDSATSQWFVNIGENSLTLDAQNGGFTVFGKVLGNGMDTFDSYAQINPINVTIIHPDFTEVPLNNVSTITNAEDIDESNLVIIDTMSRLYQIDTYVDFGAPDIINPVNRNITITNRNLVPVSIGNIDLTGLTTDFTVNKAPCENTILATNTSCTMLATLTSVDATPKTTTFDVDIIDPDHEFTVTLTTPAPDIKVATDSLDFGEQDTFIPGVTTATDQLILFMNNIGSQDLEITSVTMTGTHSTEFVFVDNCTTVSPMAQGGFCLIPVNFQADIPGNITAALEITTNDPDTPLISIPVTAISNPDFDNVSASIEDAAPNNGDGNNDEIPDSLQTHVFSMPGTDSVYYTFITDSGLKFDNVVVTDVSLLTVPPTGTNIRSGAFSFELSNLAANSSRGFGVLLPDTIGIADLYAYGPTSSDPTDHWFPLSDKATIIQDVEITATDGSTINRSFISVTVQDGTDGDLDNTVNGVMSFTIAVSETGRASSDDKLSLSLALILLLLVSASFLRQYPYRCISK